MEPTAVAVDWAAAARERMVKEQIEARGVTSAAVLAAMRIQPGPEEAMVRDIREMALAELSGDVDLAKDEFVRISGDLNRIRTNVSAALGIFKSGAPGAGSVGPLLGIITKMLKE